MKKLSEQEHRILDDVVKKWKAHLRCGVCNKSLTGERVLYEIVLPYIAEWKYPRTRYQRSEFGFHYLLKVGLPCLTCHGFDDGPDGGFAVAFLCGKHAKLEYSGLQNIIKFAVRIDPRPSNVSSFAYDPDRVYISYIPVRQLAYVLPGTRQTKTTPRNNPLSW
ncbi:MAG: hypothetical protein ABSG57_12175 [Candidatus Bathyarchaeia archaeon]